MDEYLEFCGISKSFPGVKALEDVSFRAQAGSICALLGENGAGKSTLLKILSGDLRQDEGFISINGERQSFGKPFHSLKAGISVIYQERQLVPSMSVMENVFSGDLPLTKFGLLDRTKVRHATQDIIDRFGLPIRPADIVGSLSVAYQQMIEIMKVYRRDSKIIAFDEPTASLTDAEIAILFRLISQLKEDGKIILYVSHRLAEIFQLTDKIVVMKDGRIARTFETAATNEQELISAMVGRDVGDTYSRLRRNDVIGGVLLEVKHLETPVVHDVSFELRRGEILGFAGLVGAGRTETVRAIFGADPILSGEIKLNGEQVSFKSPTDAIARGIALCPEDRKEQGLILRRSIRDNICLPVLEKLKKGLFLDNRARDELSVNAVKRYSIKTPTVDKIVMELSGGNQQKVILGRWTSDKIETKLLILDEPTKGIDVGTKAEVYQMICDFAKEGIGVIFISSELTEVLNVSDRIVVMHNGRITGVVSRESATEEGVLALAMLD